MIKLFGKYYLVVAGLLFFVATIVVVSFLYIDVLLEKMSSYNFSNLVNFKRSTTYREVDLDKQVNVSPVPGETNKVRIVMDAKNKGSLPSLTDTTFWKTIFYEDRLTGQNGEAIVTKRARVVLVEKYDSTKKSALILTQSLNTALEDREIRIYINQNTRLSVPKYTVDTNTRKITLVGLTNVDLSIINELQNNNIIVVRGVQDKYDEKFIEITADEIVIANM